MGTARSVAIRFIRSIRGFSSIYPFARLVRDNQCATLAVTQQSPWEMHRVFNLVPRQMPGKRLGTSESAPKVRPTANGRRTVRAGNRLRWVLRSTFIDCATTRGNRDANVAPTGDSVGRSREWLVADFHPPSFHAGWSHLPATPVATRQRVDCWRSVV